MLVILTLHPLASETTGAVGRRSGRGRTRLWRADAGGTKPSVLDTRHPLPRGDLRATHGHFLRIWGLPGTSRQPESACRGPESACRARSPPDLEGFSRQEAGTRRWAHLPAQRQAGGVLNRHNPWDENKTRLRDILPQLRRNSRLLCTHCPAPRACLQIRHTPQPTLLRGELRRRGPLITFKTRPVPSSRPGRGLPPFLPDS